MFEAAKIYEMDQLKELCVHFMKIHHREVSKLRAWKQLEKDVREDVERNRWPIDEKRGLASDSCVVQ